MRNEFQLYANHPAASPGGRLSPPSGALSVLSSPVHLQFIHYVKAQFDAVRRMHREDKENPAGSPKIAAMAAEEGAGHDQDAAADQSGAEADAATLGPHQQQQQPACHVELPGRQSVEMRNEMLETCGCYVTLITMCVPIVNPRPRMERTEDGAN